VIKAQSCLAAIALVAIGYGDASAYHPIPSFHAEARVGGAARIYYTGSPRWEGQDCGSCHVDSPGLVRFHMSSTPTDIFATGRYEPGQAYTVSIGISGAEGKGLRTWMLETLDDLDTDVGVYEELPGGGCTSAQGTQRSCFQASCNFMCRNAPEFRETCAPAGTSICNELIKIPGCGHCGGGDSCNGCNTVDGVVGGVIALPPWNFVFVAPPAGTGPINLYFGGVAGTSDHSSLDDDYQMQYHRLCEGMTDCDSGPVSEGEEGGEYTPPKASGCASSGGAGGTGALLVVLLGLIFARRRR